MEKRFGTVQPWETPKVAAPKGWGRSNRRLRLFSCTLHAYAEANPQSNKNDLMDFL